MDDPRPKGGGKRATASSDMTSPKSIPHRKDANDVAHTTAQLRAAHRQETSVLQHGLDRLTAMLSWPGFVALLILTILIWIIANLVGPALGFRVLDPPPFAWLHIATAAGALVLAALILTSQRREDQLADHRAQLVLELSVANDQKIAKIVELIEESRRDNPNLANRVDVEADAMSTPSDTNAVLEAIKELREDLA